MLKEGKGLGWLQASILGVVPNTLDLWTFRILDTQNIGSIVLRDLRFLDICILGHLIMC